jgi:hypothetical protein
VLFKSASGAGADASIEAFDDTWTWGEASQHALMDIASGTNRPLQVMMNAMHSAIAMIENRMPEGYPGIAFATIGVPKDLASAERLVTDDPHQLQQWICWQVGGFPREKKGGDKGVDG